jgi:hypothetical protein
MMRVSIMFASTHRKQRTKHLCSSGQANPGCLAWPFCAVWIDDTQLRLAASNVIRPL